MAIPLVLNELSYLDWAPTEREAQHALGVLVEVMRDVARLCPHVFLLSQNKISDIVFANGLPLRRFVALPESKDASLFLLAFSNKSPFSVVDCDAEGSEVLFEGRSCSALLYAYLLQGVAVSFLSSRCWDAEAISVTAKGIVQCFDDVSLVEESVALRHLARTEHVLSHRGLFESERRKWSSGEELWSTILAELHSLAFLSCARAQILALLPGSEVLRQIGARLFELNASLEAWSVADSPFPEWGSHVTGEGETRKRLTTFRDDDGVARCYDLHARFTPGAGRIHFRLIREERRIEIAYIGTKLE